MIEVVWTVDSHWVVDTCWRFYNMGSQQMTQLQMLLTGILNTGFIHFLPNKIQWLSMTFEVRIPWLSMTCVSKWEHGNEEVEIRNYFIIYTSDDRKHIFP